MLRMGSTYANCNKQGRIPFSSLKIHSWAAQLCLATGSGLPERCSLVSHLGQTMIIIKGLENLKGHKGSKLRKQMANHIMIILECMEIHKGLFGRWRCQLSCVCGRNDKVATADSYYIL